MLCGERLIEFFGIVDDISIFVGEYYFNCYRLEV